MRPSAHASRRPARAARPPRVAAWLLERFLTDEERPEKTGDFEEGFRHVLGRRGPRGARAWFRGQVLRALPLFLVNYAYWRAAMFLNHLKIAWRNLRRHKGYSFLNVFGLALGLACAVLIMLWVRDELAIDRFHAGIDDIYLLREHHRYGARTVEADGSVPAMGPALKAENAEVVDSARFNNGQGEYVLAYGDKTFKELIQMADPEIFRLFTFPWIRGDVAGAFGDPSVIVLSRSAAGKYFGTEDPIGKTLILDGRLPLRVAGVMEDIPPGSTIRFDVWIPLEVSRTLFRPNYPGTWFNLAFRTYVRLRPGTEVAAFNARIADRVRREIPETATEPFLYPFGRVYLHAWGRIARVRTFALIALGILVIACINFMNLTTARSARRSREVGLRKVVGAQRRQIMRQFFGEAWLQTLIALLLGGAMVALFLGPFRALTGKSIGAAALVRPEILTGALAALVLTGFLAGLYPAAVLSAYRPAGVLKGGGAGGGRGAALRKALVVFQFSLSVLLITGTAVIVGQVRYMKTKSLGFDREHLLYIPIEGRLAADPDALKAELRAVTGVESVTLTSHVPTGIYTNGQDWDWDGRDPALNPLVTYFRIDPDFPETFKASLAAGEFFRPETAGSSGLNVVINETFADLIGRDRAVGAALRHGEAAVNVLGVIEDFHFTPLDREIGPMLLASGKETEMAYRFAFVRLGPGDVSRTVAGLETVIRRRNPGFPFDYRFLDDDYDRLYRSVEQESGVVRAFAALAVIISCLGLFGLAAFTAEQKTREIGIRKILGATVPGIVLDLSKEYGKWVAAANLIALPLSYYLMSGWLRDFAYRMTLGWSIFALTAVLSLALAQLTVGWQALRAARAHPARSLRYE